MRFSINTLTPVAVLADALHLKKHRSELGMLRVRLGVAFPTDAVSIVNAERSNGDFVNPDDQYQWTS
jgi:aspartyl/asparaginyl beta-hydroxylase (cupin superfamily)